MSPSASAVAEAPNTSSLSDRPRNGIGPAWIAGFLCLAALALASRLPFYSGNSFPLNDGGMFAQIVDELRANHFAMPRETAYNLEHIPLCYPPLGFYFGAIAGAIFHSSSLQVLRWLPLLFNLASLPFVYLLAVEFLAAPAWAFAATAIFEAVPRSSMWLTMGGGLTRAPGELFAIVGILLFVRACKRPSNQIAAGAGVVVGLTFLTHLEAAMFAVVSIAVLAVFSGRLRTNLRVVAVCGAVSIIVIAPWLLWALHRYGGGPFISASLTRGNNGTGKVGLRAVELAPWLALAAALWVLRKPPFAIWIVAVMVLISRSATTHMALPEALLGGWMLSRAAELYPAFRRFAPTALAAMCYLACGAWIAHYLHTHFLPHDRLHNLILNERATLLPGDLAAMQWVKTNTPESARFLVYNQRTEVWAADFYGEWFPYFANRHSVMTAQGTEWLKGGQFSRTIEDLPLYTETYTPADVQRKVGDRRFDYILISGPFDEYHQHIVDAFRHWPGFDKIMYQAGDTQILSR